MNDVKLALALYRVGLESSSGAEEFRGIAADKSQGEQKRGNLPKFPDGFREY